MSGPGVPFAVGDVIEIPEPDYLYGTGTLRLRVTAMGEVSHQPDGRWLEVTGVALRADGEPLEQAARRVLVRLGAGGVVTS